jgi:thioredoxin-related protein
MIPEYTLIKGAYQMHKTSNGRTWTMLTLAGILLYTCSVAHAANDAWMTDFDMAREKAQAENKHLLVDFSGSDWCGWCIKLDKEVFSQDEFIQQATNDFVLVLLDFPRKPENRDKIPARLQKRNEELQEKYEIRGFPTVLLLDATGKQYARTGYQRGGVQAYLTHLEELQKNEQQKVALLSDLKGATGLNRAHILDKLIQATDAREWESLLDEMQEIISLDADGTAGLKDKYYILSKTMEADAKTNDKAFAEAEAIFENLIAETAPEGEVLQDIYYKWGRIKYLQEDYKGVVALLEKALAAAPESKRAKPIQQMIKRFSQSIE